jgi:hypothetical protein
MQMRSKKLFWTIVGTGTELSLVAFTDTWEKKFDTRCFWAEETAPFILSVVGALNAAPSLRDQETIAAALMSRLLLESLAGMSQLGYPANIIVFESVDLSEDIHNGPS